MKNIMKILSRVVLIVAFGILFSFMFKTEVKADFPVGVSVSVGGPHQLVKGRTVDIPVVFTFDRELTVADEVYVRSKCTVGCGPYDYSNSVQDTFANNTYTKTFQLYIPADATGYYEMAGQFTDGSGIIDIKSMQIVDAETTTHAVTFRVINGRWTNEATSDRIAYVTHGGCLYAEQIPAAGDKPSAGFMAGSWSSSAPNATTPITDDVTYTYTYAELVYDSEPEPPVNYMREVEDKLSEAINLGGTRVVRIEGYPALSYHVLEMLQKNPDITLVSEFTYDGLDYRITIPGSAVKLDPSINWYGPKCLFPMFYMYGTDTAPSVQAYLDKYQ